MNAYPVQDSGGMAVAPHRRAAGAAVAVLRGADGSLAGGADPRADGTVVAT